MKGINRISDISMESVSRDDFDFILDLERESFNVQDQLDRESLEEFFCDYSDGIYKILSGGIPAGYFLLLIDNGEGYIESIAIGKEFRKRGLGLTALRFIVNKFNSMGIKKISLHVRTDNHAAIYLYEKEGFMKTEIVDSFYPDGKPAFIYTLDL